MDPTPLPNDEEQKVVCEMIGRFDAPAFIRRAKRVEESHRQLLADLERQRVEKLDMVRLRLGQLRALAGAWAALQSFVPDTADRDFLARLHDALQPVLRLPPEPTQQPRVLRAALAELIDALSMFNRRWQKLLAEIDLTRLNAERDAYNRYYLLEKECALGSARTGTSFRPLTPVTLQQLADLFPPLRIPAVAGKSSARHHSRLPRRPE